VAKSIVVPLSQIHEQLPSATVGYSMLHYHLLLRMLSNYALLIGIVLRIVVKNYDKFLVGKSTIFTLPTIYIQKLPLTSIQQNLSAHNNVKVTFGASFLAIEVVYEN
jgi:hypothetical protein